MMILRYCQFLLVFCTILLSRGIEATPGFGQSSGFVKIDKFEEVTVIWELVDVLVREDEPMQREFSVGGSTVLHYDQSIATPSPALDISYVGNDTFIGFTIKNISLEYAGTCGSFIDLSFNGGPILTDSTPVLYVQTHPMTPTIDIPYNPIAGGATTIICTANSLSMPEESRQDVKMIYSWMINPPKEYLVLQNNTNNHVNSTIIVEDLEKNGSLDVQCTASEDGSSFEAVYCLELMPYYAPGAVVAVNSNVTANVGDEFILQVASEDKGYPQGNYTWHFPNGTVEKDKPNQLNLIGDLSHSGNFTCYLENVVAVGDSATILVIITDPNTLTSSLAPDDTSVSTDTLSSTEDPTVTQPSSSPTVTASDDTQSGWSHWYILLIALGCLIILVVIAVVIHRRSQRKDDDLSPVTELKPPSVPADRVCANIAGYRPIQHQQPRREDNTAYCVQGTSVARL